MKYHIGRDGVAGICHPMDGPCQARGDHYETPEEAVKAMFTLRKRQEEVAEDWNRERATDGEVTREQLEAGVKFDLKRGSVAHFSADEITARWEATNA